jgi:glutathione S-transferase
MLELYYFDNSICSERPKMTLAEKGVTDWVPHHVHLFKGEQFDPAYLKLNPKAQVPTLVHDGAVIRESSLICDYLDNLYPEPSLTPDSPVETAHMREWIKEADEAGFEGVAALTFIIVFRTKLMAMPEAERDAYWAGQTVLERTQRQKSCVLEGFDSPYALRAIATWERIFERIENTIAANGPWLMGDQFTLADLDLATFIARLDGLALLGPWLADRPNARKWWSRVKGRPSYAEARVGPSGEESETMNTEGTKVLGAFEKKRAEYVAQYGSK